MGESFVAIKETNISPQIARYRSIYDVIFYKERYVFYKSNSRTDWRQTGYLTLTQDNLIKQIAEKEDIDVATVRNIFKSAEDVIFAYLSSTTLSESRIVKLLSGISIECNYIPEKRINTYDNIICEPRIWAKPKITRYYNRKLNNYYD